MLLVVILAFTLSINETEMIINAYGDYMNTVDWVMVYGYKEESNPISRDFIFKNIDNVEILKGLGYIYLISLLGISHSLSQENSEIFCYIVKTIHFFCGITWIKPERVDLHYPLRLTLFSMEF